MKVLLKNIAIIAAGQGAPQGDENYCDNGVPFVKAGNLAELVEGKPITEIQKVSGEVAKKYRLRLYKKGSVLFAKSGMSCLKGYIYVLPQDAYVVSNLACVIPNQDMSEYLKYYFEYNRPNKLIKDEAYPSISLTDIGELKIDIKTQGERENIVRNLACIAYLIELQKKQLQMFDILIKSRFIEMFGDPVSNPFKWDKVPLSELADIKIGPFGSLLHKDDYIENGHPLVNPSHIKDGKIVTDNKLTISDEKFGEMAAYHLKIGDVVMGRRGEMGRCAVVNEDGLLCGTGSLLIRSKGEVTADYIQKIISFPSFKKIIEDIAVGQTMPNLNVPLVSNFKIIKPPIGVQHKYYSFVHQVEKLKSEEQKKLEQTQTLFDSLMQKYFG